MVEQKKLFSGALVERGVLEIYFAGSMFYISQMQLILDDFGLLILQFVIIFCFSGCLSRFLSCRGRVFQFFLDNN